MVHDIIMGLDVRGSSIIKYLQPSSCLQYLTTEDDGEVSDEKVLVDYAEKYRGWEYIVHTDTFF